MIKIKKGLLIDKNVFCVSYLYFNLQSDQIIYSTTIKNKW